MTKYIVRQSGPLRGEVTISGAKNAVLPLMAATLLNDQECVIRSVPHLRDVQVMKEILESLGSEIEETEPGEFHIHTHDVKSAEAPYGLVNKMRASFLVMGPLLGRKGIARIPLPGGCAIGARPIDLHLKGFKALGAEVEVKLFAPVDGIKQFVGVLTAYDENSVQIDCAGSVRSFELKKVALIRPYIDVENELENSPEAEHRELTAIYVRRGLDHRLADQVATQLMAHDALGAHARDELGISETLSARPLQAAMASAGSFAVGAAMPLAVVLLAPEQSLLYWIVATAIVFLALLGAAAAAVGGTPLFKSALRVAFWGTFAMAVTAGVGAMFGTAV